MNARADQTPDVELLARFRAGESSAFDDLFVRYRTGLTRYASRLLRDPEEARDLCVEAFVRVIDGRLHTSDSLKGPLYTTVHRLCLDRLRRRTRWARVRRLWSAVGRPAKTPEQQLVDDRDRTRLTAAIHALPDGHRAAIGLVYDEGMSTEEAASILDITPTQLRSRLAYARRLLRQELGEDRP